ncbi:Uncharacterised protein [Vibrio cholerae]|nr:Uncharacterised protein [Vibrio cholerae]
MMTSIPARRAMSAACSLVAMPPVPSVVPLPPAILRSVSSMVVTSLISWALGSLRGSAVNKPF